MVYETQNMEKANCTTVELVAAARALVAIQNDEATVVEVFRNTTQREREHIGAALSALASMLGAEWKFQPVLLQEPIKIPVASFEEAVAVQKALFRLGCGFHNGRYPLTMEVSDTCNLSGIFVSKRGVITVMPNNTQRDRDYVANHKDRAVSPARVLATGSLEALMNEGV